MQIKKKVSLIFVLSQKIVKYLESNYVTLLVDRRRFSRLLHKSLIGFVEHGLDSITIIIN